jgi:hypothetical protein
MNRVTITGSVAGDSELRTLGSGRELLNFDVSVDGTKGKDPIVHVAYFPQGSGDVQKIEAGRRVMVVGALRHRMDSRLFIAARRIRLLDGTDEEHSHSEDARHPVLNSLRKG